MDKSHAADEGEPTAGEPEAVSPPIQPEAGEPPSEDQPQTLHASLEPPDGAPIRVSLHETPSQSADSEIHIQLNLTEGTRVRLTVEALSETEKTARPSARLVFEGGQRPAGTPDSSHLSEEGAVQAAIKPASRLADLRKRWPYSLASTLFGLALLLYLATRLIGLADFPIYFFSDEAIQTVHAADLIRDGFKDEEDTLLPTYFKNGPFYNLSLSVYLQVLPYLILGKSVFCHPRHIGFG